MQMKRQVLYAFGLYLVEALIVTGYVVGWIPVHPIVLMLPLVGLINYKVEGKGREGLGLTLTRSVRPFLLVLVFATLSLAEHLIRLRLEGLSLLPISLTAATVGTLIKDLAVDLLIIALWEEIVSRGFIQTRLQGAWGFKGVLVATLLFASLHLPSALSDDVLSRAAFRFLQTGLSGFVLGYLYWRTGSILPIILLHGLRNFAGSLVASLAGASLAELIVTQRPFQLLWLVGETGLVLLLGTRYLHLKVGKRG